MEFFSFLALLAIAYLIWRVTDQLPDLIYRLSEIQRDVAEVRRRITDESNTLPSESAISSAPTSSAPTNPATTAAPVKSDV